jgi:hypothetical protein
MKPGFLLEAARKNAKSAWQGGLAVCAISVLVLLLNGTYVYNWVAGPFPMDSALAESPGMKEFAQAGGTLIPTDLVERKLSVVRILRSALEVRDNTVSANYYLFPLDGKFVMVKTAPDFAGTTVSGRLVPLPEKVRSFPQLAEIKVAADRTLKSEDLYPTMLDATFPYRADANLFVLVAVFFLVVGVLATPVAMVRASSPQKYSMLRLLARTGPVLPTLRRIEQEFIAAGDDAHVSPLLISSAWVYDPGRGALVFALKDVIGVTKKIRQPSRRPSQVVLNQRNPPSYSVEFWLRSEPRSHSVKASDKECDDIINAIGARTPWVIIEPGSSFEFHWRRDRQFCIAEMERRRKQMQAPVPPPQAPAAAPK